MRIARSSFVVICALAFVATVVAQNPPAGQPPAGQPPPGGQPPGGRGGPGGPGGGQRRGLMQTMMLSTTAWADGAQIPRKYSQAGEQVSPAFSWTNVPDGTESFVLIAHDLDAATGNGMDDTLHWMVWNIPAAARGLPEGIPQGPQLPDGARQISVSGPYYRGPGAPASGPPHHYAFELYALDGPINVPAVGQSPALTRAAVVTAMAGHVRGKGVYVGLFKR